MKRPQFLPLLCLPLLLTACPSNLPPAPIAVSVPNDPSVLHGKYRATLSETYAVAAVQATEDRLYAVQVQSSGRFWVGHALQDGRELSRTALGDRPTPRVLPGGQAVILKDPQTMEILDAASLTGNTEVKLPSPVRQWSVDSSVMLLEDGTRAQTLTGQLLPTAVGAVDPATTSSSSSDDAWRVKDGKVIRIQDGQTIDSTSKHGNPCRVLSGFTPYPVETLLDGGVALGYPDGTVELRGPDGALNASLKVSDGCVPIQRLRRMGDGLAVFASTNVGLGTFAVLSLSRQVIAARTETIAEPAPLFGPAGIVLNQSTDLKLTTSTGQSWTAPTLKQTLNLDVNALYLNDKRYSVQGSAQLDGQNLSAEGQAIGQYDVTFKPQYQVLPQPSVAWTLTLKGTATNASTLTLSGGNNAKQSEQGVKLKGQDRDYAGTLTRL